MKSSSTNTDLKITKTTRKKDMHHIKSRVMHECDRPCSAPPVDKLFVTDDVELIDIQTYLQYNTYFRRNSKHDVRLPAPDHYFRGQGSVWAAQYHDTISKAFSSDLFAKQKNENSKTANLLDKIDTDYPESTSSAYNGKSRTTTPIGDCLVIDNSTFNNILSLNTEGINYSKKIVKKRTSTDIPDFEGEKYYLENRFIKDIMSFYTEQRKSEAAIFNTLSTNKDYIKEFCIFMRKDQEGSRHIQNRLEISSKEEIGWFFEQIRYHIFDLSSNLFGNYVIQKIIPYLNDEQIKMLLDELVNKMYILSIHPYGCRVVQKLLDHSDCVNFILGEIKDNLLNLIEDQNGNHVIQKCIEKSVSKGMIISKFEENSTYLSTHRYGCRVVQRLLEFCSYEEVRNMLKRLIDNIESLVNDQYGNYVIQHMLTLTDSTERNRIITKITNDCYELSKHKFSSNVIEQCVKISSEEQKDRFLEKFMEQECGKPRLFNMCIDMYGNYVVQRFYDNCDCNKKNVIKKVLKPYVKELKKVNFARHILYKINT